MCSLNMGLLNFFIRGEQVFFANHRSDIERFAREIAARDVKPELEVYSAAMLEEVAAPARPRHPAAAVRDQPRLPHAHAGRDARDAGEPARRRGADPRARRGRAHQRLLDGRDAAADHHDRAGDGPQRPRRDGGQRALPPRRAAGEQRATGRAGGADRVRARPAGRDAGSRRANCWACAAANGASSEARTRSRWRWCALRPGFSAEATTLTTLGWGWEVDMSE